MPPHSIVPHLDVFEQGRSRFISRVPVGILDELRLRGESEPGYDPEVVAAVALLGRRCRDRPRQALPGADVHRRLRIRGALPLHRRLACLSRLGAITRFRRSALVLGVDYGPRDGIDVHFLDAGVALHL